MNLLDLKYDREECFLSVFSLEIDPVSPHDTIDIDDIRNFCIAIPQVSPEIGPKQYSILDMNWQELDNDFVFKYGFK